MPLNQSPASLTDTSQVTFWDDFIGALYNNRIWAVTGTGSITSMNNIGGAVRVRGNASATYRFNHNNFGAFSVANRPVVRWRGSFAVPTGGTTGSVSCGIQSTATPTTSYIAWRATRGTANFECLCVSGGTGAPVSSGVAIDTAIHEFLIEAVTGSVNFFLDGVLRANITTNISADPMQPFVNCAGSTGGGATTADGTMDYVLVQGLRA